MWLAGRVARNRALMLNGQCFMVKLCCLFLSSQPHACTPESLVPDQSVSLLKPDPLSPVPHYITNATSCSTAVLMENSPSKYFPNPTHSDLERSHRVTVQGIWLSPCLDCVCLCTDKICLLKML
ncbi:DLA class II histocompatibility antigen, DR-1 beta chain-like [Platysternon megacephalum]|uniref:DLA class II histocompatibility antigen, DR-1 beta chain-like n=1 Tax=Platysternon megacephalum TaxID=55544 RepID=A0A4D9DQU5_9SAUR|nr:DLA class II histocompatibility antigen, DR-1 beta chain-like [Platysternon megacephalum]